jgi:hypothetical protein
MPALCRRAARPDARPGSTGGSARDVAVAISPLSESRAPLPYPRQNISTPVPTAEELAKLVIEPSQR